MTSSQSNFQGSFCENTVPGLSYLADLFNKRAGTVKFKHSYVKNANSAAQELNDIYKRLDSIMSSAARYKPDMTYSGEPGWWHNELHEIWKIRRSVCLTDLPPDMKTEFEWLDAQTPDVCASIFQSLIRQDNTKGERVCKSQAFGYCTTGIEKPHEKLTEADNVRRARFLGDPYVKDSCYGIFRAVSTSGRAVTSSPPNVSECRCMKPSVGGGSMGAR